MQFIKIKQEKLIKEKLITDPSNPILLKKLGDVYMDDNKFSLALDQYLLISRNDGRCLFSDILIKFETILQESNYLLSLRFNLVKFLLFHGEYDSAIDELEEIIEISPKNTDAYFQLAKIYIIQKNNTMVINVLEKARRVINNSVLSEMLAAAYIKENKLNEAISLYENIIQETPENLKTMKILAELYKKQGKPEQAALLYTNIANYDANIFEEINKFLIDLVTLYPEKKRLFEIQGDIYLRYFKPDLAMEVFKKLAVDFPDSQKLAISKYKKVLDLYPDYPEANFALAKANIKLGEYTEAVLIYNAILKLSDQFMERVINDLQEIINLCPKQILAHQTLAMCRLKEKNYDEALSELSEILKISDADTDAVIGKLKQIILVDKDNVEAWFLLAKSYFMKSDIKKAKEMLNKVFSLEKSYSKALVLLANIDLDKGSYASSMRNLKKAFVQRPYKKEWHDQYNDIFNDNILQKIKRTERNLSKQKNDLNLILELAKLYYSIGQIEKAIPYFQEGLKIVNPSNRKNSTQIKKADAYLYIEDLFYYLGCSFKEQGNFELALAQFNRALKNKNVDKERFLIQIGLCGEALGELEKSADVYQAILESNSNSEIVKSRLSNIDTDSWTDIRGKTMIGVVCEELVLLWWKNPDTHIAKINNDEMLFEVSFAQSHNNQGVEYTQKGRLKAAEDEFILALRLDHNFAVSYNNLGLVYLKQLKIEKAKECFDNAIKLNTYFYVAYYNYALAFFMENNNLEAVYYFEKAFEMDPNLKDIAVNYADILYNKNNVKLASEIWSSISKRSILSEVSLRKLEHRGFI